MEPIIFEENSFKIMKNDIYIRAHEKLININNIQKLYFVPEFEHYHIVMVYDNFETIEFQVTEVIEFLHCIKQLKHDVIITNKPYESNDEYKQYRISKPWMMSYGIKSGDISPQTFVGLMSQFYHLGWVYGSSGGMAACSKNVIYYTPSSVNKERLKETDLFVFNSENNELVKRPDNPKIKESACTPLFNLVLNETDAQCVIHTHAKYSNLLTQLVSGDKFEISNQEMIKGVMSRQTWKAYSNVDTLIVPIVENETEEYLLLPALKKTLEDYPDTCGILVRNHGLFVWGNTWQKTKIMLECYEYLFELACDMIKCQLPLV